MSNLIIQPSSNKNARQHYVDTVLNPVPLDRMRKYLDPDTTKRLEELYRGKSIPVWGFTPAGGNVGKWNRIESGDVALFLRQNFAFASSTVSFKIRNHDLAAELWGYDENDNTWEYVYFLDEIQNQKISYEQLNQLLGYALNNNFQQSLVLDEAKSQPVIIELGLESSIYEQAPTREEYYKAVAPLEDAELDKEIKGKARTEQSYLRSVNFKNRKYSICGICLREFPVNFLVAAHIKKRTECSDAEKRDYEYISMPMCRFGCDELYEKGYVGVDGKVFVVKDENLSATVLEYLSLIDGNDCEYWNDKTSKYFDWHNERMKLAG